MRFPSFLTQLSKVWVDDDDDDYDDESDDKPCAAQVARRCPSAL